MPLLADLDALFADAASDLSPVSRRRMFGCDAYFAGDQIFGLIWKEGRIGVRLPETAAFDELMALEGAAPWKAGNRTMSAWVLVPEGFHDDPERLRHWVERAHAMALTVPPKKAAGPRKTVTAGAAARRATRPAAAQRGAKAPPRRNAPRGR